MWNRNALFALPAGGLAMALALGAFAQPPAEEEAAAPSAADMRVVYASAAEGARVWNAACASCHGPPNPGTPSRAQLLEMTADDIYHALTAGKMVMMAENLNQSELRSISMYLTGKPLSEAIPPADAPRPPLPANAAEAAHDHSGHDHGEHDHGDHDHGEHDHGHADEADTTADDQQD